MVTCVAKPDLAAFITIAKERLPIVSRDREKSVLSIVAALNGALPEDGIIGDHQYIWQRNEVCPMDAISLLYQEVGAGEWRERSVIALYWDLQPGLLPVLTDISAVPRNAEGIDLFEP